MFPSCASSVCSTSCFPEDGVLGHPETTAAVPAAPPVPELLAVPAPALIAVPPAPGLPTTTTAVTTAPLATVVPAQAPAVLGSLSQVTRPASGVPVDLPPPRCFFEQFSRRVCFLWDFVYLL